MQPGTTKKGLDETTESNKLYLTLSRGLWDQRLQIKQ